MIKDSELKQFSQKETSIKKWYAKAYPTDELKDQVADITFYDLYKLLVNGKNVYPYLADDSIVRERTFEWLAYVMNLDYEHIYQLWLNTED